MQITFSIKELMNQNEITKSFEDTKLGVRVKYEDGLCRVLTLQRFNWKQLHLLFPLDKSIEKHAKSSLRPEPGS